MILPRNEQQFLIGVLRGVSAWILTARLRSLDRYQQALEEIEAAAKLDPERPLYRARREELLKLMKDESRR